MAFGDTALLDDFNRADATDLGANWTAPLSGTDASLQISGNVAAGPGSNYWNVSIFGPACEAYVTLAQVGSSSTVWVHGRATSYGANLNGYAVRYHPSLGTDFLTLARFDNDVETQLGEGYFYDTDPSVGDRIGVSMFDTTITGYTFENGVWTERLAITDTSYGDAGSLGLKVASGKADDFGGGTIIDIPVLQQVNKRTVLNRGVQSA